MDKTYIERHKMDVLASTIGKLEKEVRDLKLKLSFREYLLNEAKQVGNIYHFTTLANIENIVESNKLKKGREKYVSLTRDFQLPNESGYFNTGEYIVRLTFDGDKMSENIKFYAIKDIKYNDEREEGVLNDIHLKYLKQIDILTSDKRLFSNTAISAVYDTIKSKFTTNLVKKWVIIK